MKKNNIIRFVCFCLCVLLVVTFLCQVFHYDKAHMRNRLYTYTKIEDNSVDAVIIGTSGIHCFWIPGQAYTDYGVTMYTLTINGMQVYHILPMLKYALKYQNPKIACIDMRPFLISEKNTSNMEYRSRYFNEILPMWSPLRMETTDKTLKYMSQVTDTSRFDLTYWFNILRYHDMWEDGLSFGVLKNSYTNSYGYLVSGDIAKKKTLPVSEYTDEYKDLIPYTMECLEELIEYAEKKGVKLVFVNTPQYVDEEAMKRTNTLFDYLDKKGLDYFDCTTEESLKKYPFDNETDFYDRNHANYSGASKFTDYFGKYLAENYRDLLPDRRTDASCDQWANDYAEMLKRITKKYKIKVKS
ncbi:MAG: hypothetical protein IJK23_11345 [Clostridia bacterium]|nr:hypothetical protein [Clostridia bacterium]